MFKAWLAREAGQPAELTALAPEALPEGEVLVKVAYSTLNYKDALAVTGTGRAIRSFPMIPGIDLVGEVQESSVPDYQPGQWVLATGWGLGEQHWGGFAELARVQGGWLVPLPEGLHPAQAMGIGTAGVTAMLCVLALTAHGVRPESGDICVTGASGGVGSIAVALLATLGYRVVASSGKEAQWDYLRALGAAEVIGRMTESPRPSLGKSRWAGAIDTVGGVTLANLISNTQWRGSIAACGLAGSSDLQTTVFPFILRAVNLLGVESVQVPRPERLTVWERLLQDLPQDKLAMMMHSIALEEVLPWSQRLLAGELHGRVVVEV